MSSRSWQMRIEDILAAIDAIESYTAGMHFGVWCEDRKTIDAVLRNLEIIGEASRHLPRELTERFDLIPWAKMRGLRNLLAHEYFGVDEEMVWRTVKEDLPDLAGKLRGIRLRD